ncbi:MAG: hypothetical protein II126_04185, partial [Erysipelotrichaceae bacterium]|nr:hypothetical protein [Erysipelotrichaceae bacterium]
MNTFLFEQIENALQLAILVILTAVSIRRGLSTVNNNWSLLAMFYGAVTLGNLYWFLYMMLYDKTPYYGFISDFSWVAAYMFLILMLAQIRENRIIWKQERYLWPVPVFTFAMAVFYMRWGDYLTNVFYALCMTVLLSNALAGIRRSAKGSGKRLLYFACLAYCLVEYSLWTVSCFSWDFLPVDPYNI